MSRRRFLFALLLVSLAISTLSPAAGTAQQATPSSCLPSPFATPVASPAVVASPINDDPVAVIDGRLRSLAESGRFSGAVLLAQGGRVLLEAGYGIADRTCRTPVTVSTTFRIGSITKQFTAAAILLLEEEGKLSIDDPIITYLPDFPRPEGDGVPITIHHLLSHTSGIPELFAFYSADQQDQWPATSKEIVYEIARDHELDFTPGTAMSYSNTGYLALGLIVEAAAGESYESYVRTHIFEPARMSSTGFEAAGDARPSPALGYRDAGSKVISFQSRMDIAWSAGGMYSTVGDLHRWHQVLDEKRVLSPESIARLETPVLDDYGYGLAIVDLDGHRFIGHDGGIDGFVSIAGRFPDDDLELIALVNQESAASSINLLFELVMREVLPS
jgi:CubicO group peptidase (beta-lactamase class C family)